MRHSSCGDLRVLASTIVVLLSKASSCFGLSADDLVSAMTFKKLVVGKDVTHAPQPSSKAHVAKSVIAKLLYGKLFKWLISRLNQTLVADKGMRDTLLVNLDHVQ